MWCRGCLIISKGKNQINMAFFFLAVVILFVRGEGLLGCCACALDCAMFLALALFLSSLASQLFRVGSQTYVLDDSIGLGRQFDGIGGLSGGGVVH